MKCVIYAWDDGWGEEHWWVDDVEMIDGKPVIRDDFYLAAQGVGPEPAWESLCWSLEELIEDTAEDITSLPLVVFGGDDGTIDLADRTVAEHRIMPIRGFEYWKAANSPRLSV